MKKFPYHLRNFVLAFGALAFVLLVASCGKDDEGDTGTMNPIANFNIPAGALLAGDSIIFENTSLNSTSFGWDFGDSNSSNDENPSHSYRLPGIYDVELTAFTDNQNDIISKAVTVNGKSFDEISVLDIFYLGDVMSTDKISIRNSDGLQLQTGDIILYKLDNALYGKLQVLNIDPNNNDAFSFKAVSYEILFGTIYSETSYLEIRGTYSCNLWDMEETSIGSNFFLQRENANSTSLVPTGNSHFTKY